MEQRARTNPLTPSDVHQPAVDQLRGIAVFLAAPLCGHRRVGAGGCHDTRRLRAGRFTQIRPFSSDQTIKADWAPSGRRIAVTENANHYVPTDSANIVTMRPNGSSLQHLTNFHDPQKNAYFGSYSPDGRWLVYRLQDHGLFGLYRMHPDGSHQQAIIPLSTLRPSLIDWGARPGHH